MFLVAQPEEIDLDLCAGDRQSLYDWGVSQAHLQRPSKDDHFESREGQDRPEPLRGHESRDPERRRADQSKELGVPPDG